MPPLRPLFLSVALATSLLLATGCAQSGSRDTPAAVGSIEGRILHPAHAVPAMRICAIGSGAPAEAKHVCIRTRRAQDRYRIEGLPADDYTVFAAVEEGLYPVGGHVQPVQCIRAPCPEMPKPVTVAPGAHVADVDLNRFYDRRDDFPVLPSE